MDEEPVDLNALAIERVRRAAEQRERYARLLLVDADVTDRDSQSGRKARAIVERAIAAMGGRERLLAIRELRVRVWIELQSGGRGASDAVLYPVAEWHYAGWNGSAGPPRMRRSLSGSDGSVYGRQPPGEELGRFYALFAGRWGFLDEKSRHLREEGERVRWHFLDRFLGEGIVLVYLGRETFFGRRAEVIRVDDRRYGHYMEAFFSVRTGLLIGTREGLSPGEQQRYRREYQMPPPIRQTTYEDYRPVGGVLMPLQWRRSGPLCPGCKGASQRLNRTVSVRLRLDMACNGAPFSRSLSDLAP